MNRPTLNVGDVVRLSRRGRIAYAKYRNMFDRMVVQAVSGDSSDGHAKITCTYFFGGHSSKGIFARKHLWNTGYNVITKTSKDISNAQNPVSATNNNGRAHCLQCGEPTKLVMGLFESYDVCNNSLCSWFKN